MPMPVELLRWAQPDRLADGGEVVSGAAVGEAFTAIRHEERLRAAAKKPVPFPGIGSQPGRGAAGDRQQTGLSELSAPERQDARLQIDIGGVEGDRLADPEAGDRDQAEQGRTGQRPDAVDRRQFRGGLDDAADFLFAVDVGTRPAIATGESMPAAAPHASDRCRAAIGRRAGPFPGVPPMFAGSLWPNASCHRRKRSVLMCSALPVRRTR